MDLWIVLLATVLWPTQPNSLCGLTIFWGAIQEFAFKFLTVPDGSKLWLFVSVLMSAAVLGPKYSYTQLPKIVATDVVFQSLEIYTKILKISYVKDKSNCILWTIKTNLYQRFGSHYFQNQILINV